MFTNLRRGITLSMVAGLAGASLGQTSESFSYPAGAGLFGLSGGVGFSGSWQSAGYGSWSIDPAGAVVVKDGLLLATTGGKASTSSGGAQRTLATPIAGTTGTSVWISFVARQAAGDPADSWLGVKLPCSGPGADPFLFLGKPFGQTAWGADNGLPSGQRAFGRFSDGESRIVARIDFLPGKDRVVMWMNPPLGSPPSDASADLVLAEYANLQNITKVLIETGSSSGTSRGSVDEVRLGSSYSSVTPVSSGVVFKGKRCTPVGDGSVEVSSSSGLTPRMRITQGVSGVESGASIDMQTLGCEIKVAPGAFPPGSQLRHRYRGWDGLIRSTLAVHRAPDGTTSLEGSLPGASSVRVFTLDANGGVIGGEVSPGENFYKNLTSGGQISGPCPDGAFPQWIHVHKFYDPPIIRAGVLVYEEHLWYFGCPGSNNTTDFAIAVSGVYDAGMRPPAGTGTMELIPSGPLASFDVLECSELIPGKDADATVSGTGDVLTDSSCSDGSQCTNQASRRTRSYGIGSSGQDGVEVKWPKARPSTSASFTLGDIMSSNGSATLARRGTMPGSTAEMTLDSLDVTGNGHDVVVHPDFTGVGATQYTVTGYSNGDVVWQSTEAVGTGVVLTLNHIICGPGAVIVWGWVTEWQYYQPAPYNGGHWVTYWGVKGCLRLGTGGGSGNGTQVDRVIFTPVNPQPDGGTTSGTAMARNVSEAVCVGADSDSTILCPGDFNGDGFLDGFDYDDFVACFEGAGCPGGVTADFNRDGFTDGFDYDDFVTAFEAGCL